MKEILLLLLTVPQNFIQKQKDKEYSMIEDVLRVGITGFFFKMKEEKIDLENWLENG